MAGYAFTDSRASSLITANAFFNGLERLFPEKNRVAYQLDYFFKLEALVPEANTSIQMIASGPNSDREQIKLAFIKLITSAKKRVWIQTPYLVPDDSVLAALRLLRLQE